jgi:hypothetical protein
MTALLSCAQDAVAFLSRGESDESDEQLILEEKDSSTLELTSLDRGRTLFNRRHAISRTS